MTKNLPIYNVIPQILSALETNSRLVLQAATGAGKTTAVPLALLDAPWLEDRKILILEPRRLAARSAAERMAQLLDEKVGERVGYLIKNERVLSSKTKILVLTEGILTRMLQSDMALEDVGLIIFDEYHERNLHADLGLALSLQSQELLREDLRIMVMSATLNTEAISSLLSNAPIIVSKGRSFPVTVHYLDHKTSQPSVRDLPLSITKLVTKILKEEQGNILIFLPGLKEIKQCEAKLKESIKISNLLIAPLYGNLDKKAQERAIKPSKIGERKIVLSTNIAESSLNIEGITVVIDSGLQRVVNYESASGMNKMSTTFISQDSATQRAGRAGRFEQGSCYRLWSEHKTLVKHATPEILSSDITPMMLELARWGVEDIDELQWLDTPTPAALTSANTLLTELSALENNKITAHGDTMLSLGAHPRLAHMMIKAKSLNLGAEAALLSALLGEKDLFRKSAYTGIDLLPRIEALRSHTRETYIDNTVLTQVLKNNQQFRAQLSCKADKDFNYSKLGLLLAFAYPDRIAKIRDPKSNRYILSGGKGAQLNLDDELMRTPFLVISNLDASKSNAQIYSALRIDEEDITRYFSHLIVKDRETTFNATDERIEAREITKLGSIILKSSVIAQPNSEDIKNALLQAIKSQGLSALNFSKEASTLRERVNFLNHHQALKEPLPDMREPWLLENLSLWLAPHIDGIKTFKALCKLDTHAMFLGLLTWEQQQSINTLAPAKLKVPSGSNIILNYSDPSTPTLEVRLQELFGMSQTPKLINNTLPLTITLLSPAHRPMQVTKDLKSFWENTYSEVKKELRGKYKKHYWPDDPLTAVATSKTKKNM